MILRARILAFGFALAAGAAFAVADAHAERLIVSVSNHRVTVTPNYAGEELVLFGSVEKDDKTPANRGNYDLVVTVSGPRADMVTRRKERRFGIWVNNDYRQFLKVPTYLAIFSNRPFDAIAPPEVQRRQQLGLNNVLLMQRVGPDYADVVPDDARAERLIVSVSNHRVTVTPNYAGEELVLFGSVEKDDKTPANRGNYDLVVTVSGPRADMVTRRKERRFGIWVNNDYRQFLKVPTYLAIFSNRPFEAIAPPEVQRRQQLGLNNVLLMQRVGPDYADVVPNDAFRSAFVRLRSQHGLYREATSAVTFLTPTLFRTGIPLPGEVPIGTYDVDIKLFADGALVTRTDTAFEIVKVGFEQFVANTARQNGFTYGLVTAFMALMTGWMASIVFRKD